MNLVAIRNSDANNTIPHGADEDAHTYTSCAKTYASYERGSLRLQNVQYHWACGCEHCSICSFPNNFGVNEVFEAVKEAVLPSIETMLVI